ncbi:C10 family peptidase [Aquimarina sp. M1]
MKNINTYLVLFVILLASCQKDDENFDLLLNDQLNQEDTNFLNQSEAVSIANEIFSSKTKSYSRRIFSTNGKKRGIFNVVPIGLDESKTSYYIINYSNGGFIIISADKRAFPVLAFSEENNFDTEVEAYPSLLVDWLESQNEYIEDVRNNNQADSLIFASKDSWNIDDIEIYISSKLDNSESFSLSKSQNPATGTLSFQYGPLLLTNWGQGVGYNNSAPFLGCSNYSNGRAPTGCVATAMSQIMKHYQYPSTYNWGEMANNTGSDETSRLMKDAGNSVGMDWGCNGSGAETEDAASALKNTFGYLSANYKDFSISTALSELGDDYPVILRGGERDTVWLIFNVYENGHAWVCDGIREYNVTVQIPGPRGPITVSSKAWTYHMNWGWSGTFNGWYSGDWRVNNDSFSYEAGMIYNIRK